MGLFSEINASGNAASYKNILLEAIKTGNNDIILFCKEHIYPKYEWELGEAFEKEDPTIKEYFSKTNKNQ